MLSPVATLPPGNPVHTHRDPRRVSPNQGAHPLVRELDGLMRERGNNRRMVSAAAGLTNSTVRQWMLNNARPGVDAFEAALAAIGYRLHVRQIARPAANLVNPKGWRGKRASVNPKAHWLVHFARFQAERYSLTLQRVAAEAGVPWAGMRAWWRPRPMTVPTLNSISAVLEAMGFQLEMRPAGEPR